MTKLSMLDNRISTFEQFLLLATVKILRKRMKLQNFVPFSFYFVEFFETPIIKFLLLGSLLFNFFLFFVSFIFNSSGLALIS